MKIRTATKRTGALLPTDIVYQTSWWGAVKSRLGWKPLAVDFSSRVAKGDVLVLTRPLSGGASIAYVPQGPEAGPVPEAYGPFLEALSLELRDHLDPSVAFLRFDLPWDSPYVSDASLYDEDGLWRGEPDTRLAELRMNFGTRSWRLRKAPADLNPPDTVIVDLARPEEEILRGMHPKTRYNIGLARRKGVQVRQAPADEWPRFHDLYLETARRNGFEPLGRAHFQALMRTRPGESDATGGVLLLAEHGGDLLAGAIVSVSGRTASFLHGASSSERRNWMAPYLVQWEAMRLARALGCVRYDLCGIPPRPDPAHSLAGLYRYKTGFGGRIVHRTGCWDYPLDPEAYEALYAQEAAIMTRPFAAGA